MKIQVNEVIWMKTILKEHSQQPILQYYFSFSSNLEIGVFFYLFALLHLWFCILLILYSHRIL